MLENNDNENSGYNVHNYLKGLSVHTLQQVNMSDRLPYSICALNVAGSLNIGTMIRNAIVMGANHVIVFGRRKYDARSCVGSQNYVPITRIDGLDENGNMDAEIFQKTMFDLDLDPIFIEQNGKPISEISYELNEFRTPCLVFGCETHVGIPESIIGNSENVYTIPQLGVIRSMNVACASSIAMWEMRKYLEGKI